MRNPQIFGQRTLLNNLWVKEITRKILKYLKIKTKTYQNLLYIAKRIIIALKNASTKKKQKTQIYNLSFRNNKKIES